MIETIRVSLTPTQEGKGLVDMRYQDLCDTQAIKDYNLPTKTSPYTWRKFTAWRWNEKWLEYTIDGPNVDFLTVNLPAGKRTYKTPADVPTEDVDGFIVWGASDGV